MKLRRRSGFFTFYSILEQVPEVQELFYQAHINGDVKKKALMHEQYHLKTCITLKQHLDRTLQEMQELLNKINTLDSNENPRLDMIHQNNLLVTSTFRKVKGRVDAMIQSELRRRKQSMQQEELTK